MIAEARFWKIRMEEERRARRVEMDMLERRRKQKREERRQREREKEKEEKEKDAARRPRLPVLLLPDDPVPAPMDEWHLERKSKEKQQ